MGANGAYAFTATTTSLLASLAFIGKFVGCWAAGPVIERWGHRQCFVILSIISLIGITSKLDNMTARISLTFSRNGFVWSESR